MRYGNTDIVGVGEILLQGVYVYQSRLIYLVVFLPLA
jgi:hypothetical protein